MHFGLGADLRQRGVAFLSLSATADVLGPKSASAHIIDAAVQLPLSNMTYERQVWVAR